MRHYFHKLLYIISITFLIGMGIVDFFWLQHDLGTANMVNKAVILRNFAALFISLLTLIPISWDLITKLPKLLGIWISVELWITLLYGFSRSEFVSYSKYFFPAIYAHFARGLMVQLFFPPTLIVGLVLTAILFGIYRLKRKFEERRN